MKAFRAALEKEYGTFGANVFDTVLGHRLEMRKSLRACDVRQTLSNLALIRQNRFVSEINRQLNTSPHMLELSVKVREAIHRELATNVLSGVELASLKSASDIAGAAQKRIEQAINKIRDQEDGLKTSDLGSRKNLETNVASNEPTGLKFQGDMFGKGETSVGDMIRHGLAGEGMRLNRSATNPVLLEKLKMNGVEPGQASSIARTGPPTTRAASWQTSIRRRASAPWSSSRRKTPHSRRNARPA